VSIDGVRHILSERMAEEPKLVGALRVSGLSRQYDLRS
jgi:hypothetical protein